MRSLSRGAEPFSLAAVRLRQMARLRSLGFEPKSADIDGYQCVSSEIWRSQGFKCCYCEYKIAEKYNDVEHYRPKAAADRLPGCKRTHGYWWLAFTWDNLLFACPACNRSSKNSSFPLEIGSVGVVAESTNFFTEKPLLLDPYLSNPVEHIEFIQAHPPYGQNRWLAHPRFSSEIGFFTIKVCDLNRDELIELRSDHFDTNLAPAIEDFYAAVKTGVTENVSLEVRKLRRLIGVRNAFSAFNYDVLRASVPFQSFANFGLGDWPDPSHM